MTVKDAKLTLEASVSIHWVETVIRTAASLGSDRKALLAEAGLSAQSLTQARWPIDDITRLWHAAERCTGDNAFGLKTGINVRPANVDVLGLVMQSAATLREAIAVVQKYQTLISDGGSFQLLPAGKSSWLIYHPQQGKLAFSPHQIEAVLSAVVALASSITGRRLTPQQVQLSQPAIGSPRNYRACFGCSVTFNQAFSGLLVTNHLLDTPLPQADSQLAKFHERYSNERLVSLRQRHNTADDVRQWIRTQLGPDVPTREEAATRLGISGRTLARRLKIQRCTFHGLLDEVRHELALEGLNEPHRPLADIAQSLGYAELSPFYRAFRRWEGVAPGEWRRQLGHAPIISVNALTPPTG